MKLATIINAKGRQPVVQTTSTVHPTAALQTAYPANGQTTPVQVAQGPASAPAPYQGEFGSNGAFFLIAIWGGIAFAIWFFFRK